MLRWVLALGREDSRTKTGVQEFPIHMLWYRGKINRYWNFHAACFKAWWIHQTVGYWRLSDVAHVRGQKGKLMFVVCLGSSPSHTLKIAVECYHLWWWYFCLRTPLTRTGMTSFSLRTSSMEEMKPWNWSETFQFNRNGGFNESFAESRCSTTMARRDLMARTSCSALATSPSRSSKLRQLFMLHCRFFRPNLLWSEVQHFSWETGRRGSVLETW